MARLKLTREHGLHWKAQFLEQLCLHCLGAAVLARTQTWRDERYTPSTLPPRVCNNERGSLTQLDLEGVTIMWGVCKPLMDEQLSIAASTIEDLKLFSFLYIVGGITLTGAGIYVKVGSHLCEGVVAHVPEGDKGHGGLLAVLERNVILTRHYR